MNGGDLISWIFDSSGFLPRIHCGPAWTDELAAANQIANLAILVAYVTIPIAALVYWRTHRRRAPELTGVLLGGAFVLSCGVTHLSDFLMFYTPAYRWDTLIRVICAAFSWAFVSWICLYAMRSK